MASLPLGEVTCLGTLQAAEVLLGEMALDWATAEVVRMIMKRASRFKIAG